MIKAVFGCRKTFSGKYIFSGNANFRKRKIFLCVWLHFKKFSGKYFLVFGKEEGKHKPKKNIINDRDLRSRSRDQRCELAIDLRLRSRDGACRSRSEARARDGAISRSSRDRVAWSSDWRSAPPGDRLTVRFLLLSRTRALSLSLSFSGNALK